VSPPPDTIEAHRARLIDAHQVHGDFVLSIRGIIASPSITSRVRWTLHRNFVTNFVTQGLNFVTNFVTHRVRRGNFVTNFVTPSISAPPRRVIYILARPASLAPWGILKCPTCPNRGSDDFLCGTGTSERLDNRR
jgi:hypothetical protein